MYTKKKKTYERHNVWRSYSDMMAGLLLLFVLVMCVSFMQAQKNYQERLAEEAAHRLTQDELTAQLQERENQVTAQQSALDAQSALLASQQADLDAQSALLSAQQADLDAQSALVLSQQSELEKQNSLMLQQQADLESQAQLMLQQQTALENQEALMLQQQQKIEQIIGVKADLISTLKNEFNQQNIGVSIDETDGSLILDSNVLFGYNENELTEEGNSVLGAMLPTYCNVLMTDEYLPYLAEISIDGYTDTTGSYMYNLQLSQRRALAVADYLFSIADSFLSAQEQEELREKLTASGHSMSNPVYGADGQVDMDASRRVEIKFRLKDEEMINEMKAILDSSSVTAAETPAQ